MASDKYEFKTKNYKPIENMRGTSAHHSAASKGLRWQPNWSWHGRSCSAAEVAVRREHLLPIYMIKNASDSRPQTVL